MPEITDPQDDETVVPEGEIDGVVRDEGQGNGSEELADDAEDYPERVSALVESSVHLIGDGVEAASMRALVEEVSSKEGFGEYLGHLEARGKFQQLLDYREAHPNAKLYGNEGEHVMNARIKKACFIDFDENGMPYSNDVTPQYAWADFREYRRMFFETGNVPEQLAIMRRASVAELLRKLVSKDLDYGESQDVDTTEVGLYTEPLDQRYIRMITRDLNHAFSRTREPLAVLFEPFEEMLAKQMRRYATALEKRSAGRFQIVGPRIQTLASTILKMLKEGKTTAVSVTDLVGFTAPAPTESDLLSKIEADPNKYLDQLYQIVHNLRCAYGLMQQESSHSPAVILENYGIDFGGPMSIVRTKSLY